MTTASKPRAKRPAAVTILTWVLLVGSLLSILTGVLIVFSYFIVTEGGQIVIHNQDIGSEVFNDAGDLTDIGELLLEGIWYTFSGIVQLVITVGFVQQKRWAWVAAMSWQALKLLIDVTNGLAGNPEIIPLSISILLVLLLNQSDVRRVFGIRRNSNDSPPTPPLNTLNSN